MRLLSNLFIVSLILLAINGQKCCSCLTESNSGGCSTDSQCQQTICGQDPFCCDTSWDNTCVDSAKNICPNPQIVNTPTPITASGNTLCVTGVSGWNAQINGNYIKGNKLINGKEYFTKAADNTISIYFVGGKWYFIKGLELGTNPFADQSSHPIRGSCLTNNINSVKDCASWWPNTMDSVNISRPRNFPNFCTDLKLIE